MTRVKNWALVGLILLIGLVAPQSPQTHQFQAEVGRLMDIIINSLYTQKQVFLRQMISNASDALDKLRYQLLSNGQLSPELQIRIDWNTEDKWISIKDNGIGMTRADLIKNLGTVAKTGTTDFIEAINKQDINLIGQFGVGFYSAFLVGSKVEVCSRHRSDQAYLWQSSSANAFTVSKNQNCSITQGTQVKIHLKQEAFQFSQFTTINKYVQKYSSFINFPIYVHKMEEETQLVKKTDEEFNDELKNRTQEKRLQLQSKNQTMSQEQQQQIFSLVNRSKEVKVNKLKWQRSNKQKVLWMRERSQITKQEYQQFYKNVFMGASKAQAWNHFRAEGDVQFTGLLFVQERAPYDLYQNFYEKKNVIKLYVRRVLINDQFEDLLPKWLNFVQGIVDSDSLSLSVSRENLQHSKQLKVISKKLTKKAIQLLKSFDPSNQALQEGIANQLNTEFKLDQQKSDQELKLEKFQKFQKNYGKNLRLGIVQSSTHREDLASLCRFYSTKNITRKISLNDYVDRMKEDQKFIYFIGGQDQNTLADSPLIQKLVADGYEVILGTDSLDQSVFDSLKNYLEYKTRNVASTQFVDPTKSDQSIKIKKLSTIKFKPLIDLMEVTLRNKIKAVKISDRLVNNPAVLVADKQAKTPNRLRLQYSTVFQNKYPTDETIKPTFQINPNNAMIQQLLDRVQAEKSPQTTNQLILSLYYATRIHSGFPVTDGTSYSQRFFKMINVASGITQEDFIKPIQIPAEVYEQPKTQFQAKPEHVDMSGTHKFEKDLDEQQKQQLKEQYNKIMSEQAKNKQNEEKARQFVKRMQAQQKAKEQAKREADLKAEEEAENKNRQGREQL